MPDRRPDYRPGPGDRRPGYNPRRPDRPTYTPPRRTTYRPVYRVPVRDYYGTRNYHRPPMYRHAPYTRYVHTPWGSVYVGPVRYARTYDYYSHVRRSYPNYVYMNWIYWPTTGYSNGYYVFGNYPYYVHNGYRYRYSTVDYCNYQLVDSYTHQVQRTYWNQVCNSGFDQCSYERDRLNDREYDNRFFCAETTRDESWDTSRPTYDYQYSDINNDGYDDSTQPYPYPDNTETPDYGNDDEGQDCYDYDYENDVCYDTQY